MFDLKLRKCPKKQGREMEKKKEEGKRKEK